MEQSQSAPAEATPVDIVTSLLRAEKVTPDAPEPAQVEQPEGDSAEPAQNAQVEGEDAPETVEEPAIPLEQLEEIELEIEVQGKKEKRPIKELRKGYMRQEDYSKKTADLARQREELDGSTRQAIEGERNQSLQALKALQALVVETAIPEFKGVDMNKLATEDPFEYVRRQNRLQQFQNTLQTVQSKITELETKQKEDTRQSLTKEAKVTRSKLEETIPGFNDELYQSLMKKAIEYGSKPEKIQDVVDVGIFTALHKANLYDQLKAGKPPETKRVAVPPTAVKPGAATVNTKQVQRQGKALEQLRKSGRVDAMASFLGGFIK